MHIHRNVINNSFLLVDNYFLMDMEKIWAEAEIFGNYRYIFTLKPEITIIYLCDHGLKHNFDQLVYVYEIAQLIRRYGQRFDWKKLVATAEECGLGRVVYFGLYFAKEILCADIPKDVLGRLRPGRLTAGERLFVRKALKQRPGRYGSYPVYLALRGGASAKAAFLFRTFFLRDSRPKDTLPVYADQYCPRLPSLRALVRPKKMMPGLTEAEGGRKETEFRFPARAASVCSPGRLPAGSRVWNG